MNRSNAVPTKTLTEQEFLEILKNPEKFEQKIKSQIAGYNHEWYIENRERILLQQKEYRNKRKIELKITQEIAQEKLKSQKQEIENCLKQHLDEFAIELMILKEKKKK